MTSTTELRIMEARLTDSEQRTAALESRLVASEVKVQQQENQISALLVDLNATKMKADEQENRYNSKVAFSVGLGGEVGPVNTDITLKFSRVLVNVGKAYNPITGIFTAPMRGVYYFRFTILDHISKKYYGIKLMKNGRSILYNIEWKEHGNHSYLANGLTVELETGDVVYTVLPSGLTISDSIDNHSNFTGFLLFST
ncbi:complement C1q-like protein 2 [Osmerus eperlanus]|uniref:complement C1q-like protein 2 n=1 Tax=Osmerus eperlanus TaxID=29151 RepID=UPI002E0DF77B